MNSRAERLRFHRRDVKAARRQTLTEINGREIPTLTGEAFD
jgi:hypothetical protein